MTRSPENYRSYFDAVPIGRRWRLLALLTAFGLLAALPSCTLPERRAHPSRLADFAVLVSLDGLRPDALEQARTPHLDSLRNRGVYSDSARAVVPSATLINHASMVSGVGPARLKIDWNEWDASRGRISVPTIFDLAKRHGLKTALFPGKRKLWHLARPDTIDYLGSPSAEAEQVGIAAAGCIRVYRPQLVMVHFADPDLMGHQFGWMSAEQLAAIERCDRAFGLIVQALEDAGMLDHTFIVVSADHGGQGRGHGSAEEAHTRIPWLAAGPQIPGGLRVTLPIRTYDTAATLADALGLRVPSKWKWEGQSVLRALGIPENNRNSVTSQFEK